MFTPELPITTDRLVIRPFTDGDLTAVYELQSNSDVVRYLLYDVRTLDQVRETLAKRSTALTFAEQGDRIVLAVELRATGEFVGELHLEWVSEEHRQGEIGFVFDPRHHGHGYAGESAPEMLRLGFDGLGLHRIIGRADGRNAASAGLMTRLGMRKEAHLVQNEIVKGEWTDEVVFAVLADEWRSGSRLTEGDNSITVR